MPDTKTFSQVLILLLSSGGWQLRLKDPSNTIAHTTEGDKLLALLANPGNVQSVLVAQSDGSLTMDAVDFSLADDPYQIFVRKKTSPGVFSF